MAERALLKFLITLLAAPIVFLSRLVETFGSATIVRDVQRCLHAVDELGDLVPARFVSALFAAEDHRNNIHPGVDPIAIMRATWVFLWCGQCQGGSTVEQQFVRVVLGRYERTLRRKLREQILAISISRRRTKTQIASAYLSLAYYGSGHIGLDGLIALCGPDLHIASQTAIRGVMARLKYPQPAKPSPGWRIKYSRRIEYISEREQWLTIRCGGRDEKARIVQEEEHNARLFGTPLI